MKQARKEIALERMEILIKNALSNAKSNPELSQKQAMHAKKISTHYRIQMPYELRMMFCKKCKGFIAPSVNSRTRIGSSSLKSIRTTCNFCSHTYRKVIAQ
jgi:ribonuclease P protein subunit RPR2